MSLLQLVGMAHDASSSSALYFRMSLSAVSRDTSSSSPSMYLMWYHGWSYFSTAPMHQPAPGKCFLTFLPMMSSPQNLES